MRVIFLDIDGVLNSRQSVEYFKQMNFHEYEKMLCPMAMSNLRYLVKTYDLKIVVSSTWRKSRTVEQLSKILSLPVLDKTGVLPDQERGEEIKEWLGKNPQVTDFVIFDDDSDMGEYLNTTHFIRCSTKIGLSWYEVDKAKIHFDKFTLKFSDLKAGKKYKLFSKPYSCNYLFDGKTIKVEDSNQEAFFYPERELFAEVSEE